MPLDFPNTSTTGTVYTGTNNVVYIYDGVRWNGNGTGSLIPPINLTYDLGSTSSQWLNLYVGNAYVNGQPVGSVTTGTTAPTGGLGKLWYNPDVGRLYIYYDSYWVDASPPVGSSGGSGGTIDLTAVTTDVLPNTNLTYNLGSPSKQWRSLYVGTSTIYIGGTALSISTSGSLTVNGAPVSSFNTATLVTRAVSANTASFATTSGYAQSFNTATLVASAVSATSLVSGTSTFSVSSTGSVTLNNKPFVSGGIEFVFQNPGFNYTVDGFSSTFPALTVVRGQTYYFNLTNVTSSHPLALRLTSGNTSAVPGTTGNSPSSGSYGNGTSSTVVIYRVPFDAPTTIVYQCVVHAGMIGTINIVDQGSATTASFATTSGYALSFNTATLVTAAVSATNIINGTWTLALSTAGSILINGTVFSGGSSSATTSTLVNGTWTVSLSTSGTLTFPTNTTFTGLASTGTTSTTAAALGYMGMPQNSTATSYTLVDGDQGKHIYITATGQTITVPANGTTAFPIGTTIAIIAGPSATSSSIAITTDTMYLGGTGTTGTRTLAAYGMATLVKVAATTWFINGSGLT